MSAIFRHLSPFSSTIFPRVVSNFSGDRSAAEAHASPDARGAESALLNCPVLIAPVLRLLSEKIITHALQDERRMIRGDDEDFGDLEEDNGDEESDLDDNELEEYVRMGVA